MHWIDTVASYLPSLIVNHLINRTTNEKLPSRQEYDTVCLFADVSGFTALSEAMMDKGGEGVEGLAKHLNSYFGQMVRIIASEGGDVFKFAGDALIVLWPPPTRDSLTSAVAAKTAPGREDSTELQSEAITPMERRVRRAAQCAFAIQDELHNCELAVGVRLSVKIGIGMGKVSVLHLGGVHKRMEYIAVGEPLLQAFTAEHHATPGDVIISDQAYKLLQEQFVATQVFADDYCKVTKKEMYTPLRKQNKVNMLQQSLDDPALEVKVKGYIPGAVLRNLRPDSPEDEHWSNEIRRVTVLFVNLGLKEQTLLAAAVYDEAMEEMHKVMVAVQNSVYEYEGSINKFLMDDKGSTLVAVYGLPPVGHADDPTRGVLAALRLCERLFNLAKTGSVGITTGEAFCGVVGSKTRKEYTVLGDSVNLAARLMQRATAEDGGVICELSTKRACGGLLQFKARGEARIKGKTARVKVFQPYPPDLAKPQPPQYLGANVYGLIHNQQRQNYAMHKLLTSLQAYFARPSLKEVKEPGASNENSGGSTPVSDQRLGLQRLSSAHNASYATARASRTSAEDEDGGEEGNMLLGKGDESDDEDDLSEGHMSSVDVLGEHVELQEPGYMNTSIHQPFQTGPLPIGLPMDEDYPYDDLTNRRLVHPPMLPVDFDYSARSDDDENATTVVRNNGNSTTEPAAAAATGVQLPSRFHPQRSSFGRRSPDQLLEPPAAMLRKNGSVGASGSSSDLLSGLTVVGVGAGKATADGTAGTMGPSFTVGGGANITTSPKNVETAAKTTMLLSTADGVSVDGGGSTGGEVAAASAESCASSGRPDDVAVTRSLKRSSYQSSKRSSRGTASPGTLSPVSVDNTLPSRGMSGRRQGDSYVRKVFRSHVAGEGGGPASTQPSPVSKTSPSAATGQQTGCGSSWATVTQQMDGSSNSAGGGQGRRRTNGSGASGSGAAVTTVVQGPGGDIGSGGCSSKSGRTIGSSRTGGSAARLPSFGSSATVMPRSMIKSVNSSNSESINADAAGNSSGGGGSRIETAGTSVASDRSRSNGPGGMTCVDKKIGGVGGGPKHVAQSNSALGLVGNVGGPASSTAAVASGASDLKPDDSGGPGVEVIAGVSGKAARIKSEAGAAVFAGKNQREFGLDVPGDAKEELSPNSASVFDQGKFPIKRLGSAGYSNNSIDEDAIYSARAKTRRMSKRLSITQNGIVPLPTIPDMLLPEPRAASVPMPRYSRYSSSYGVQSLGGGGGAHPSGHGITHPRGRGIVNNTFNSVHQGSHTVSQALLSAATAGQPNPYSFSTSLVPAFGAQHQHQQQQQLVTSSARSSTLVRRGVDGSESSGSNCGGGRQTQLPTAPMVAESSFFDDIKLQVIVPHNWLWDSLPNSFFLLPPVFMSEVGSLKDLVDRCWRSACEENEVMDYANKPSREELVLNIVGTRVVLPTDPDYDINWLPAFIKEASGTRGVKGFKNRKPEGSVEWVFGGGRGVEYLYLLPRKQTLNVQSRWLQCRVCLLQHKISLISKRVGSVVILEGLPGAGKTEVLSVFAARTLERTALIHFTAASPYHADQKFGGWSMVLQQYLDSLYKQEIQAGREDRPDTSNSGHSMSGYGVQGRASVAGSSTRAESSQLSNGAGILGQKPLNGRDRMLLRELEEFPAMQACAFLVNDVLGTAIPKKGTVPPAWDANSSEGGDSDSDASSVSGVSESDDAAGGFAHHERQRLRILLQLVKNMAKSKLRVVVIDDAQFLDRDSWTLALAVATGGPMGGPLPLMLVVSLRPLAHYRGIFSSVPPDYQALTEVEHVNFLKIEGAPPEEVEDLVAEKLGASVVAVGDTLFDLVEDLCTGNPLMITELVSHLKMKEPRQLKFIAIRSEEGEHGGNQNNADVSMHAALRENFQLDDSLLPEKINAVLTSQTDRLNSCQLMALKVASLIGKEFSTWFLYRVYPINGHKDRLLRELAALEEQGFLVEVQGAQSRTVMEKEGSRTAMAEDETGDHSSTSSSAGNDADPDDNIVYKFTHGFMMEMLQLKMLKSQKSFLKDRIKKLKESIEAQRRHDTYKNLNIDSSRTLKKGALHVMKYKVTMSQAAEHARETTRRRTDTIASRALRRVKQPLAQKWGDAVDWKKRTCKLTAESLALFTPKKDKDGEPSQIVYLEGATAEPELGEVFKDSAFRLESSKWKKGDELVDGGDRRTFTFLAETRDIREAWLYRIRYCIEVMEVQARRSGPVNVDRFSQVNNARFGSTETRQSDTSEGEDSTLVVNVEEADNLVLEPVYGKTYPYCMLDLDDQGRRTSSVQSASVNPVWRQEIRFPVSVQQWVRSSLRIQMWNHDLFLTDDFLGQLSIPLKEVPVLEYGREGDAAESEPKWYNLECRHPGKRVSGRLLLKIRLLMTERTSSWFKEVGFVEHLKSLAEHRKTISTRAARVGQLQQRRQSSPGGGLVVRGRVGQPRMQSNLHRRPGSLPSMPVGRFRKRGMSSVTSMDSSIRHSIRSMELEVTESRGGSRTNMVAEDGPLAGGTRADRLSNVASMDGGEEDSAGGVDGSVGRSRRRRNNGGKGRRRQTTDSSLHAGIPGIPGMASEVLHQDPLTRQLQLILLAVETKARVASPQEGGGGSVDRDWIRMKLKDLLTMVGRGDLDLDELDMHTYYCKDRKENVYGPFPAKQLVEAHNAGYINDRKVVVREARMRGEFRPIGSQALMHGPSRDEAFKSLTTWPQADAHHTFAEKIFNPDVEDGSKDFRRWSFNIFALETEELGLFAATILEATGLPRVFGIGMKRFAQFVSAVGFFMGRKPHVSYHNFYHAVDVMHATSLALDGMGASGLLSEVEQLGLLLSALCHDLDHPGLTNSFQTATESPLASQYNDQAPLEHHHLAVAFQILRREGCDIVGHLEKAHRDRIRQVMIQSILATEMSEHRSHVNKMENLVKDFPAIMDRVYEWQQPQTHQQADSTTNACLPTSSTSSPPSEDTPPLDTSTIGRRRENGHGGGGVSRPPRVSGAEADTLGLGPRDRLTVASALLHGADVSSPGRAWPTCRVWVTRLMEEFQTQADEERQRGLPVTVLESPPAVNQPVFIDVILIPFLTAMMPVLPGLEDEYLPLLRSNRERWIAIANQEANSSNDTLLQPRRPSDHHATSNTEDDLGTSSGSTTSDSARAAAKTHGSASVEGLSVSAASAAASGEGYGDDNVDDDDDENAPRKSRPSTGQFAGPRRYSSGTLGVERLMNGLGAVVSALSNSSMGGEDDSGGLGEFMDLSYDRLPFMGRVRSDGDTTYSRAASATDGGVRDGRGGGGGGDGGAAYRRHSSAIPLPMPLKASAGGAKNNGAWKGGVSLGEGEAYEEKEAPE